MCPITAPPGRRILGRWFASGARPSRWGIARPRPDPTPPHLDPSHQHARRLSTLGLDRWVEPIRHCRTVGKAQMVRNDASPEISIDPETYQVRIDAVHRHQAGGPDRLGFLDAVGTGRLPHRPRRRDGAASGCCTAVRLLGTSSAAVQAVLRSAWSPRAPGAARCTRANLRAG
jgi:hypothetical protein